MLRNTVDRHDVRQVDLGRGCARKLDLSFLGSLLKTLECHRILTQIHALLLLELIGEPVDDHMVEVITAKVCVAVGCLNLKHAVAKLKDRDIECAATEVEHSDLLILVGLVKTVGERSCGRLVHDTFHGQTRDLAGFLCSLTLRVVEVCRYGDHSLGDCLSEIILGGLLHLLEDHSRDLLRSVVAAVDVDTRCIVGAAYHLVGHALYLILHLLAIFAHEALDGVDRTFRVRDSLTLGGVTHLTLTAVNECHD